MDNWVTIERQYGEYVETIFDIDGNYIGEAYRSAVDTNTILIKSPFTTMHKILTITDLYIRGYQFSSKLIPPRVAWGGHQGGIK